MQEHNGYSHQNPGFIDDMLNRNTDLVNVYFPVDAVATAYAVDEMMKSKNKVNVLCAGKDDDRPIFLNMIEAEKSIKENMILVEKYSDKISQNKNYDFVIVGVGDYLSLECIAGIDLINKVFAKNEMKDLRDRFKIGFLNIAKLSGGDIESVEVKSFNQKLKDIIGEAKVFANFHGHPQTLERYFYDADIERKNITVRGYIERGGINTLLGMHIINKTSRYDVAEFILKMSLDMKKINQRDYEAISGDINKEKSLEQNYIDENFADSQRIKGWAWGEWN
jgi:xylulose-5-phosphate/fructose-6-phosphate phosphoketolase